MAELKQLNLHHSKSEMDINLTRPFSDYLGTIVSAATLAPPGAEVDTAIRCIRRPHRKRCHGLIRLHLQENPAELTWWCPVCNDSGVIHNWAGSSANLTRAKNSENVYSGSQYCEVLLNKKEYTLLSEVTIFEPVAEGIVRDAAVVKDGIVMLGTIEGMDCLLEYIAFEANHEQRTRRYQTLNKIFDKISHVLAGSV